MTEPTPIENILNRFLGLETPSNIELIQYANDFVEFFANKEIVNTQKFTEPFLKAIQAAITQPNVESEFLSIIPIILSNLEKFDDIPLTTAFLDTVCYTLHSLAITMDDKSHIIIGYIKEYASLFMRVFGSISSILMHSLVFMYDVHDSNGTFVAKSIVEFIFHSFYDLADVFNRTTFVLEHVLPVVTSSSCVSINVLALPLLKDYVILENLNDYDQLAHFKLIITKSLELFDMDSDIELIKYALKCLNVIFEVFKVALSKNPKDLQLKMKKKFSYMFHSFIKFINTYFFNLEFLEKELLSLFTPFIDEMFKNDYREIVLFTILPVSSLSKRHVLYESDIANFEHVYFFIKFLQNFFAVYFDGLIGNFTGSLYYWAKAFTKYLFTFNIDNDNVVDVLQLYFNGELMLIDTNFNFSDNFKLHFSDFLSFINGTNCFSTCFHRDKLSLDISEFSAVINEYHSAGSVEDDRIPILNTVLAGANTMYDNFRIFSVFAYLGVSIDYSFVHTFASQYTPLSLYNLLINALLMMQNATTSANTKKSAYESLMRFLPKIYGDVVKTYTYDEPVFLEFLCMYTKVFSDFSGFSSITVRQWYPYFLTLHEIYMETGAHVISTFLIGLLSQDIGFPTLSPNDIEILLGMQRFYLPELWMLLPTDITQSMPNERLNHRKLIDFFVTLVRMDSRYTIKLVFDLLDNGDDCPDAYHKIYTLLTSTTFNNVTRDLLLKLDSINGVITKDNFSFTVTEYSLSICTVALLSAFIRGKSSKDPVVVDVVDELLETFSSDTMNQLLIISRLFFAFRLDDMFKIELKQKLKLLQLVSYICVIPRFSYCRFLSLEELLDIIECFKTTDDDEGITQLFFTAYSLATGLAVLQLPLNAPTPDQLESLVSLFDVTQHPEPLVELAITCGFSSLIRLMNNEGVRVIIPHILDLLYDNLNSKIIWTNSIIFNMYTSFFNEITEIADLDGRFFAGLLDKFFAIVKHRLIPEQIFTSVIACITRIVELCASEWMDIFDEMEDTASTHTQILTLDDLVCTVIELFLFLVTDLRYIFTEEDDVTNIKIKDFVVEVNDDQFSFSAIDDQIMLKSTKHQQDPGNFGYREALLKLRLKDTILNMFRRIPPAVLQDFIMCFFKSDFDSIITNFYNGLTNEVTINKHNHETITFLQKKTLELLILLNEIFGETNRREFFFKFSQKYRVEFRTIRDDRNQSNVHSSHLFFAKNYVLFVVLLDYMPPIVLTNDDLAGFSYLLKYSTQLVKSNRLSDANLVSRWLAVCCSLSMVYPAMWTSTDFFKHCQTALKDVMPNFPFSYAALQRVIAASAKHHKKKLSAVSAAITKLDIVRHSFSIFGLMNLPGFGVCLQHDWFTPENKQLFQLVEFLCKNAVALDWHNKSLWHARGQAGPFINHVVTKATNLTDDIRASFSDRSTPKQRRSSRAQMNSASSYQLKKFVNSLFPGSRDGLRDLWVARLLFIMVFENGIDVNLLEIFKLLVTEILHNGIPTRNSSLLVSGKFNTTEVRRETVMDILLVMICLLHHNRIDLFTDNMEQVLLCIQELPQQDLLLSLLDLLESLKFFGLQEHQNTLLETIRGMAMNPPQFVDGEALLNRLESFDEGKPLNLDRIIDIALKGCDIHQ
ncbi:hypothetical protein PCE1_004464 [Barthelona sp. PCE]